MTQALDAMVKAMREEIERQDADWARYKAENPWVEDNGSSVSDLVAVARAGLAAIKIPPESVADPTYDAFDWGPPGYDEAPQGSATPKSVFRFMVDKILE